MNESVRGAGTNPASEEFKHNLWQAFTRSVRDNIVAEFALQGLRVIGLIALARLLNPGDFGLLRILVVVSVLGTLMSDAGLPDALVQRREITPEHESTAWWISLALAMTSASALYLAAPLVARILGMQELVYGIHLICVPVLLEGTAVTANARLRRRLKFRALAAADVAGEIAFLSVALLLFWMGFPRQSLPGGLAARLALHALTISIADSYIPRKMPRLAAARDLWRFAIKAFGANLTICLSTNADYLLVGRLLGATALGYYSISWDLLRFIPGRIHRVAVRVIFPAFSRLQDDDTELGRAYSSLVGYLSRVVLPFIACVALAAPEVLSVLYGPQWAPAAVPMRLLAGGLALSGLREGMGAIYYAKDRPSIDIYVNATRLMFIVVGVFGLASKGLVGVSAGMSVIEGVTSLAGQFIACMLVGLTVGDLLLTSLPGLRLSVWCIVATMAGKMIANLTGASGSLLLAMVSIPPAVVFLSFEATELNRMLYSAFPRNASSAIEA